MADGQVILLNIESVETKIIKGTDEEGNPTQTAKMTVKDVSGKKYSYFVDEADGNFGQGLCAGNRVYAWTWDKESTFKGKRVVYHNIGKPRDDVPPVPPLDTKGIPISPPLIMPSITQAFPSPFITDKMPEPPIPFYAEQPPEQTQTKGNGDEHKPYTSDKDTKIRWMNAMNNAVQIVAGLDLKKLGEPQIKNYIIEYANFFNTLEAGMSMDTLPISKSQTIKLHEIAKSYGLNREDKHAILKAITGRTIGKTTDLTFNEAVECILQFDNIMKKGDVFNKPTTPVPVKETPSVFDEEYDGTLPF